MDEQAVEKAFLEELESLEKFRLTYTSLYPQVPLAREDPDVRRMVEALAFFSARTRVAAERTVGDSLLRLFRQHFPYALSPMPAMAMLGAQVTQRFVDVVELPRGMEVLVERKADQGDRAPFRFRTTAPLRVLPIELTAVEFLQRRGKRGRMLLRFEGAFPRNDAIGTISVHINHLNDLPGSMRVLHALKTHVKGASVVFDKEVREDTQGERCTVGFGAHAAAGHELEAFEGPVETFRGFLHVPQREMYAHFSDIAPPRNWRKFAICLEIDEAWPPDLRLTHDTFVLHAVPMVNIKRDMANPIECDGTKERYLVRHPDVASGFVPHTLLGVYQLTEKGMAPIEPGVLGPTTAGWECVFDGKDAGRRGWLLLDMPDAFENPERVSVEAFWMQPEVAGLQADDLKARLADRHAEGLEWLVSGSLAAPANSEIVDDRDGLLALVALKSLRFLGLDELTFLVRALGSLRRPEFARLTLEMSSVKLATKPAGGKASGICYVYEIEFDRLEEGDIARLDLFCGELLSLLEAWSIEQVVEIVARVPRLSRVMRHAR
jgi:type VI secretion system protein ImpG